MYENINTPAFIINQQEFKRNIKEFRVALERNWSNFAIGYSYKTNSLPWIINFAKEEGCYAEVVSDCEYRLALKMGYSPQRIIFNGPNKGKDLFNYAIVEGSIVNIDSYREIKWLEKLSHVQKVNIGIRVNFDLEKLCPNEASMGNDGSRFGFSLENGELFNAISELRKIKNINICGIHLHNSSKTRSLKIYKEISKMACEICKSLNIRLDYIDIGGGFFGGLPDKPSYDDYINIISQELKASFDYRNTKLIVEPGAALISSPLKFVCEVVDVKNVGENRIVTVNGSRINVDPLMHKTSYFLRVLSQNKNIMRRQVICGFTCMENDRLVTLENLNELSIGDKLIFSNVGAYTMCLSPLFIEYFPRVLVEDRGSLRCVREMWDVEEYMQKSYI